MLQIDIGFNFFGTCTLKHLDAAWYSLSRQDFTGVRSVHFLDNNTPFNDRQIQRILRERPIPVPLVYTSYKHQDPKKAHSWSVNLLCRHSMPKDTDWIFWTRSDYILEFECLQKWREGVEEHLSLCHSDKLFVTSFCHLIGYNFTAIPGIANETHHGPVNIEKYHWRQKSPRYLVGRVPGYSFEGTERDAGVWLTQRQRFEEIGWMDERLSSWGFQQSVAQLKMKHEHGVKMMVATEYFYHHMEHPVNRDMTKARAEFEQYIEPIAK